MKYVCSICGYIYDEDKEKVKFDSLPDTWTCPLCGAAKSLFKLMEEEKKEETIEVLEDESEDLTELSISEFGALCSNLARGCEKQYKNKEASLYNELAAYFDKVVKPQNSKKVEDLSSLFEEDLKTGFDKITTQGTKDNDRGALRANVWATKVTGIVKGILDRYKKEGDSFIENTKIWVCTICGFVYIGDNPPKLCPVCKVQDWKFEEIKGGNL